VSNKETSWRDKGRPTKSFLSSLSSLSSLSLPTAWRAKEPGVAHAIKSEIRGQPAPPAPPMQLCKSPLSNHATCSWHLITTHRRKMVTRFAVIITVGGWREGCDWLRWFRSKAESAAKHYTIPREDIHFLRKVWMYCTLTPRAKLQCASRADSVNSCGIAITVSGCHCFSGRGTRSAFPAGGGGRHSN
jgi:hypothetical protein